MKRTNVKASVLVVEDETLIAEELADRLPKLGYEVVARAATADAAIDAALSLAPDLILMDIRLKGRRDGIRAAEDICRELHVPVVYLTAHSDEATLRRAMASKPFGYVLKPFQEKDLTIALEMALERHAVEKRLFESEQRYATTLRSIGDGVIAVDGDQRVTFLNPAAERLTGWTLDEVRGWPIGSVMQIADGGVLPILEAALERLESVEHLGPFELSRRGGETVSIEDSAAPILDSNRRTLGVVLAFRDCSEREAARTALRETERRLEESQRLEALGRLAGGVAHDFNNVLAIIMAGGELLRPKVTGMTDAEGMVERILDAVQRGSAITEQLLDYGRRSLLVPVVVDLNALVGGLGEQLESLLPAGIELAVELSSEPLHVRVEPSRFEQVVFNLVTNAIDAMRERGGHLLVETRLEGDAGAPDAEHGARAVLKVRDTGVGMDDATRRRIFEPFFTTKPSGRGTGLGLATVFGTVRQFGGEISVVSAPRKGSTFSVHLPIIDEQLEPRSADATESTSASVRGTESVLLVEDDVAVRQLTAAALRALGYSVTPAQDAAEALERFESDGPFRILVTDLALPGPNGRFVAERLRARQPDLPVIFVTGHTDDEVARRSVGESEAELLHKPFSSVDLARRIRDLLDR